MKIQVIDLSNALFPDVIILGKQNAKTLGMFPEGAFIDHARNKTIFGAVEDGVLMGYILFRITQSKRLVSITHVCIKPDYRKRGVGKLLLNAVKEKYARLYKGISLRCRKDYVEASRFWETFGFKAIDSIRSRSKDEHYLVKWWYDFGNSDLFSDHITTSSKINAVLDANIIMKLSDEPCKENAEALALIADWLSEEADYFFAPEVFNEINRDGNLKRAAETRKFIHTLHEARFNSTESDLFFQELNSLLPGTSANDHSDRKQLAESISAGIDYFITLDTELMEASDSIYEKYSIKVLRPADFILFIDHNTKGRDYNSYRLAGARHEYANIRQNELDELATDCWLYGEKNEKKHQLIQKLTAVISDIQHSVLRLVKDNSGKCIAYFAITYNDGQLILKLIRTVKSKIADILFQQLIKDIILLAIEKSCSLIKIEDDIFSNERMQLLYSFGFDNTPEQGWCKINIIGQQDSLDILNTHTLINQLWATAAILKKMDGLQGTEKHSFKLQLEKKLWPVKFTDIELPTYIIPIKPHWAGQLFDHYIADHTLFGSKPELSWSKENIYYRSVKPVTELSPARILWYVSSEARAISGRDKSIVATSYLEQVHIGPAKILFQKFKNYGIYEWKDIYKLADQDSLKEIKALKFTDTEVFKNPVSLRSVDKIMKQFGRLTNTFASPVEVSSLIFNEVYRIGKQ